MQKALQIISLTMVPVCGYLSHHLHHYVVDASQYLYSPKTTTLRKDQTSSIPPKKQTHSTKENIYFYIRNSFHMYSKKYYEK